jgi:hypothetical protein
LYNKHIDVIEKEQEVKNSFNISGVISRALTGLVVKEDGGLDGRTFTYLQISKGIVLSGKAIDKNMLQGELPPKFRFKFTYQDKEVVLLGKNKDVVVDWFYSNFNKICDVRTCAKVETEDGLIYQGLLKVYDNKSSQDVEVRDALRGPLDCEINYYRENLTEDELDEICKFKYKYNVCVNGNTEEIQENTIENLID